jgi:hypothetical protein
VDDFLLDTAAAPQKSEDWGKWDIPTVY